MMISVCMVSGFSIGASAATSEGQKFDINLSQNSTWKNLTSLDVRFASADGTILSSKENVTKSNGVFQVTAPAGATQIEISSAPFSLSGTKAVASGCRRIVLKNPVNGTAYTTPYVHYYGGDSSHSSTTWPGTQMTALGNGYYYCDIHSSYSTLNFSDNGNTSKQTADLSIEKSYSGTVSYYNGSSWTNPFVKTIDISAASSNSEVEIYLQSDGTFQESKYLSTLADQSENQKITFATVFVINENWNSLNSVYATYDYNDPYRAVVKLDKDTYNGVTVFKGKIPEDALLRFHPQASSTTGASTGTSYPTYSAYDSTGYTDSTATYKITSTSENWGKFSDVNKINYDATVTDRFSKSSNIIGVEATYYDYLSDNERANGYLNNATNSYADGNAMWFPFTDFNKYISSIASEKSGWTYPLYFGNLYKEGNQYGYSTEVNGLTRYYDGDYRYAINNSNGLSNYNQSIQGLAYSKLDGDGDIQAVNGVKMPYFDTDTLSAAQYSNSRVAKVFKSSFPFRSSTNSSGVTTYSFNSKNATDNVYFTWDGDTPKYVNYGAGTSYGVMDAAQAFGNSADGYGIFPFNNNSAQKSQAIEESSDSLPNVSSDEFYIQSDAGNYYMYLFEGSSASKHITLSNKTTVNGVNYFVVNKSDVEGYAKCILKPNSGDNWSGQTGNLTIANLFGGVWKTDGTAYTAATSKTYTRGGNDNLDFGFGVRLDIDFRVPENGTVDGTENGEAVKFDYSGDDDLWVYIGTDPTGADADLVLDLGGDHKEATGSINFKTMQATANDVYADYSTTSSSEISVPSDEIWIKTDSSYTDFCLHVWQDTGVGILNDGAYFVKPNETSDGFYKFKKSQLGNNTEVDFEKYMNTSGYLANIADLSSYYGHAWNGDGSAYTGGASGSTNRGPVMKTFNNGVQLDPNTTYHMVVFYMERGLAESNFSVEFTMTPANNDLKVNKALDTADVVSEIANDLKENETYTYSIKDKNGTGDSSGKAYTINEGSDHYLENSSFQLKDSDTADFNNTFKTESQMVVSESINNSALSYDTSWELVDNKLGGTIKHSTSEENSRTSAFDLVDPNDSSSFAQLQLNYTNKIKTSSLSLTKYVRNEDGSEYNTDKQFVFQLLLDLDGDGSVYSPKAYPVEYTVGDDSTVYRASADGKFTIKKGQTITLLGLPVGAAYTLKESASAGFIKINDITGTINATASENAVKATNFTNPVNTVVSVNKTLDGSNYSGSVFTYTITGFAEMTTQYDDPDNAGEKLKSLSTAGRSQTKTAPANGVVTFDDATVLNFVEPGYYRFKITEDFASSISESQKNDYTMDASTILVEIEVDSSGVVQPPKYYKIANSELSNVTSDSGYAQFFNEKMFVTDVQTLENKTTHGSVTVAKKAQDGASVAGTTFGLIKVSGSVDDISSEQLNSIIQADQNIIKAVTNADGSVTFENLVIFENGESQYTNSGTWTNGSNYINGSTTYQKYCLFEYSPADGYNPTYVKQFFTLPKDGDYDITLDDVVDGLILSPNASGSGMTIYFLIGLGIIATGALLFFVYQIYDRNQRKKRRARHNARH